VRRIPDARRRSDGERAIGRHADHLRSFRMIDMADLTWNKEKDLVWPGEQDRQSGSVPGVAPRNGYERVAAYGCTRWHRKVALMNNGARKGGSPQAWQTIHEAPGTPDIWQLHFAVGGAARSIIRPIRSSLMWTRTAKANGFAWRPRRTGPSRCTTAGISTRRVIHRASIYATHSESGMAGCARMDRPGGLSYMRGRIALFFRSNGRLAPRSSWHYTISPGGAGEAGAELGSG